MNRSDDARSSAADAPAEAPVGADERLDEAIEETFPASDPIAVSPERDDAAARAVLTVGHSTRPIADFIALLRAHGVTQLVDVRTVPRLRSPRAGSINGGWRNRSFQGYADYMQTEAFADAVMTLIALAERERVAIMCAEAVPWRCHRSLIADALVARGVAACEIVSAKRLQPHRMTPFAVVEGARVTYPPEPASADGAGDDDAPR
jgi:hypothetical protein